MDEALVHDFVVLLIRGMWQVPSRRGKVVSEIPLQSGELLFDSTGKLRFTRFTKGPATENPPGSTISFEISAKRRGHTDQQRRIARAILKIGLGFAYHEAGPEYALQATFDPARRAILGDPYEGYLLTTISKDIQAPPDIHVHLLQDVPGITLAARLDYGWTHFMVDMLPKPITDETRAWANNEGWSVTEIATCG